jgi:hypothetical protein
VLAVQEKLMHHWDWKVCVPCIVLLWQRLKRKMTPATVFVLKVVLASQICVLAGPTHAATVSHEQTVNGKRLPLGSLSATGEVYVNEKPVPVESTVFAGDAIRTGQNSTAVFTLTGNGTLKIGPQTQVVISSDQQFAAELQGGTVVIDSISGPSGIKVRAGSVVVVPAVRSRVTSAKIEGQPGGVFQVTCIDGDISTIPLSGSSGRLLEAGQSVSISPQGQLAVQKQAGGTSAGSGLPGPLKGKSGWTILGLVGAGAGAAALALGHGGSNPVSPSGP